MVKKIVAAADGSSLGNPGPAGWCWFVDNAHWQAGGWENATNNQAELTAVLDLLTATAESAAALEILCDSKYVINCCTEWLPKWKKNGWRKADRKPVENQDLLRQLDAALQGREVEFKWVKGHAGNSMNESADERARAVATAYRDGREPDCGPGLEPLLSASEITAVGLAESSPLRVTAELALRESQLELQESEAAAAESGLESAPRAGELWEGSPELTEERAEMLPHQPVETREEILQTLLRLETELLSPQVRANSETVRSYMHPDYIAHASNGQIWNLEAGLRAGTQALGQSQVKSLDLIELGEGYLLRWASLIDGRKSIRVSLWQRGGIHGWQLRFTQATMQR